MRNYRGGEQQKGNDARTVIILFVPLLCLVCMNHNRILLRLCTGLSTISSALCNPLFIVIKRFMTFGLINIKGSYFWASLLVFICYKYEK